MGKIKKDQLRILSEQELKRKIDEIDALIERNRKFALLF